MEGPIDVSFVLPGMIAAGGVRAVFELAGGLRAAGLQTEIVIPERSLWAPRRTPAGALQRFLPSAGAPWVERIAERKPRTQDWFPLQTPVRIVPAPLWRGLGNAAVVVATSWRTAEEVARGSKERGVYLVQHLETWSGPARRVDATWRAFDRMIVTSEWLRERAVNEFGKNGVGLAVYGVDRDVFRPGVDRSDGAEASAVGFLWDPRSFKGGADVLAAVGSVRATRDLRVRAFGLGDAAALPEWVEFSGRLTGEALADFYRGLDVFVSGSWTETGPMTVPEAMACGTPVVTTDVGNVRLWSGGSNAVRIVEPRRPRELAEALSAVLDDPAERARMSTAGIAEIAPFTWERMTADFLSALRGFGLLGERP